jgi:16S rRNA (guanine(966)-N(2))-methyltransferase RsmD
MRIIGGTARSIQLTVPSGIRPTTDAMRETLFNVIGDRVVGSRWLDLFAGSGSVGLEALSRGAAHCTFVDNRPQCLQAIRANLERLGLGEAVRDGRAAVVRADARRVLPRLAAQRQYDFAFVDPPYGLRGLERVLDDLLNGRLGLAAGAVVVVQHSRGEESVKAFRPSREKVFGESVLAFFAEGDATCD